MLSFPTFSCSLNFGLNVSSSMTIDDDRLSLSDRGGGRLSFGPGPAATGAGEARRVTTARPIHGGRGGTGEKMKKEDQPGSH